MRSAVVRAIRGWGSPLLVAGALFALAAGPASAASTGGAFSSPIPVVSSVQCAQACAGVSLVRPGSVVLVRGRALAPVVDVVFLGTETSSDDMHAKPSRATTGRVTVRVPKGAVTGPIVLVTGDGAESKPSAAAVRVGSVLSGVTPGDGATGPHVDAEVATPKVFFDDGHPALLSVLVKDAVPATVTADLIRLSDGAAIAHWDLGTVAPEAVQSVEWDGLAGGRVQRQGRYAFEVTATNASGAGATTAATVAGIRKAGAAPAGFLFLPATFPIQGAHEFGDGVGRFGAQRNGHTHQGQDVFADCGAPLVAARGGTVRWKGTQALAGNYLVIDGEKTGVDNVYMHLRDPALVDKGDRVLTGQPIGFVGDTGDADACHLHFEMWSAPGWYRGGSPFDPLPSLRSWDRTS